MTHALKPKSLSGRLLLAAALVLPVFLGFSAYMLDLAFHRSLLAAEREQLNTHIYLLLAAAEFRDDEQNVGLTLPEALTEPRFSQPNAGLYGFVFGADDELIWRSPSARLWPDNLVDAVTATARPVTPGESQFATLDAGEENYYRFDYDVAWETDTGNRRYRFSVLHTQTTIQAERDAYRRQLWWLLGGLALLLLIAQALIMRWGLRPLATLAKHLHQVEQGETSTLQGDYPQEIQPVTDNLNRVLTLERTQRERYRNTLADLAHSLKTPLAVLRGGLNQPNENLPSTVEEQVTRMDQIVRHQLQRAVIGAQNLPGQKTDVVDVIERLAAALQKVYADKHIRCTVDAPKPAYFHSDEPDLMELLGNILENAFKYGRQQVKVTVEPKDEELRITIADDGPGIPDHLQHQILQRGARADTAQPGHGIGLAIAVDIVSSYRGSLGIGKSALGGAEFGVVLPII
ncbi:MAG TPA: ATP-binding protein [Gammaproteobacteria bacterium]